MSDIDSFAFEPGQQVKCKTRHEDEFKGEVVAFDLASKVLIIKSPSSAGTSGNHDLHFLVLDSVSDVEVLEEPPADFNNELPSMEMKHIQAKQAAAIKERMKLVEAVSNGVTQEGISLYSAFSKIYVRDGDIVWKDKVKIVVMNSVVISPPYKEADCQPTSSKTEKEALNYVKSNISKYWESCAK